MSTMIPDSTWIRARNGSLRRLGWLLFVGASVFIIVSCSRTRDESPLRPTATIKEIMDSMVDPSADALWDAVATIISAAGTEERQPRTDEEWADLHRHAVELVEATNLLLMEGRHVSKSGDRPENPKIELSPEQIESAIEQDRQSWINFAHGLHDAAVPALKAIENRNARALFDAGEAIDMTCEKCHLKYWYPLSKQAEKVQEGAASPKGPQRGPRP